MEAITVSEEPDCLFCLFKCRFLHGLEAVIVACSALCGEKDVHQYE